MNPILQAFGRDPRRPGMPRELRLPQSPMQQVMAPQAQAMAPQAMPGTPESVAPQQQQPRMSPEELSRVLGAGAAAIGQFAGPGGGGMQNTGAAIAALAGGMGQGRQQFAQEQTEREMLDFQRQQIERGMAKEAEAAASEAAQNEARQRLFSTLDPERRQLLEAFPELAGDVFKTEKPDWELKTIFDGAEQRQVLIDMNNPANVGPQLGSAPRWQDRAPPEPKESWRPLTDQEAAQYGLQGGGAFQISSLGKVQEVSSGEADATAALRTRAGKIEDAMQQFGLSRPDATSLVEGYETFVPTADGRVILRSKATNETRDVTPQMPGVDRMQTPAPEGRARITGETVEQGVGPGPYASSAIGTIFGGFIPGATSEQTETAKAQLNVLERLTRDSLTISARPSAWEQQQVQALFADPDSFFQAPARAGIKLRELKNELVNVFNDNATLLESWSVQGSKRAELLQSNNSLRRAIDMIDIGDDEIQRLLGNTAPATSGQVGGVGWRIVD